MTKILDKLRLSVLIMEKTWDQIRYNRLYYIKSKRVDKDMQNEKL
jgi:hypothetical protein